MVNFIVGGCTWRVLMLHPVLQPMTPLRSCATSAPMPGRGLQYAAAPCPSALTLYLDFYQYFPDVVAEPFGGNRD